MDINVTVTICLAQHVQDILTVLMYRTINATSTSTSPAVDVQHQAKEVAKEEEETKKRSTPKAEVTQDKSPQDEVPQVMFEETPQTTAKGPKEVTMSMVRTAVQDLIHCGKKREVQNILLNHYGVTGYGQLQGDDLAKFYEELENLNYVK